MTVALVAPGVVVVVLVVWRGWRRMRADNDDRAWVLSRLQGKHIAIGNPWQPSHDANRRRRRLAC